jgi:hypothetical protein
MLWLTDKAVMVCIHETGKVRINATQNLVFIDGMPVLIEPDPEGKAIAGCPLAPPLMKPCLTTLRVRSGYSDLVTIEFKNAPHRLCLDAVRGLTDGHPPGTYDYKVNFAGQSYVSEVR